MVAPAADELVLVALLPSATPGSESSKPATTARERELSDVIEMVTGRREQLSRQVAVAAAIDELTGEGMLQRQTNDAGTTVLALTETGEEHAAALREQLATTSIEAVEGQARRTVQLGELADDLDPESSTAPLVGRESERQEWDELLERVRQTGRGEAAFLAGPGGIGKTTLATQLLGVADETEFDVLRARCQGPESEPYQPLRTALAQLDTEKTPFEDSGFRAEDAESFEAQQFSLFHDVTEALAPDGHEPPRVLYLDDLHLADAATETYLTHLLDRLADQPLVVLGSYRPGAMASDASFVPDTLPGTVPVTRLKLSELDRTGTKQVIERVLDRRGIPDALVGAVHERTGGNPLFVEATIDMLLETDQLDPHLEWYPETPDAIELPTRVQETIREQVAGLDQQARRLLRWAAVAGESVPVTVLRSVSALPGQRVLTTLEVLVGAGIFEWRRNRSAVTFTSEVIRDALLSELDEPEHQRRHGAIAAALEQDEQATTSADDDDPVDRAAAIAYHHEQAGEEEAAIEWYRTAVDRATDVYAHEAAIEYCYRALDLARSDDRDAAVLAVGERLAEIHRTTGEYDEARQYVRFVRERVPDNERTRRQRLARLAAEIAVERSESETAIEEAKAGLDLVETANAERCRLLALRGKAQQERNEYDRAEETALEQRELARRIDEPALEARALELLGSTASARGEFEAAREYFERAMEMFAAVDDRRGVAKIRHDLGNVATHRGALDEAEEHYQHAREAFEALGDRHRVTKVLDNVGLVHGERGDWDEAREYHTRCLERHREHGDRHGIANCLNNLGVCAWIQGDYETAREHYRRSVEQLEAIGDDNSAAYHRCNLALVEIELGNYDRAREHARSALSVFREQEHRARIGWARVNLGIADRRQGCLDGAREHAEAGIELAQEEGVTPIVIWAHLERGALARQCGEYATAGEHLEGVLDIAEGSGFHRHTGTCHSQLAALAREECDFERADEHLRQAREEFEAHGDRHGLAIIDLRRGRLARDREAYDAAHEHVEAALAAFETIDTRHWAGKAHHALGTIAAVTADPATARDRWERALDVFEECGAVRDALDACERLVELAAERGDEECATEYCERALAVLDTQTVGDFPDRRDWFRGRRGSIDAVNAE